ncbi:unnamed protein product [Acanthoscelides obtectus]|uniref:Uncharacterized protein n=1 Tax=Acanthoscelides obtectus TaxID=200917 RepID=A0A9P0PTM3_ACAOB|nr:unnamed protein product [Acanthoscelides obtectus]CAK1640477.1 hypothetical protein AOBTE_LOCUS11747 [Acanthoscelides obtectus]
MGKVEMAEWTSLLNKLFYQLHRDTYGYNCIWRRLLAIKVGYSILFVEFLLMCNVNVIIYTIFPGWKTKQMN